MTTVVETGELAEARAEVASLRRAIAESDYEMRAAAAASRLPADPLAEPADLAVENAVLRKTIEAMNASMWQQMQDRFHAFDAIRDDCCPACGGPVTVERRGRAKDGLPEGIRLVAVRT